MSNAALTDAESYAYYQTHPCDFVRNALNLRLAQTQKRILLSIWNNRRTIIVSGNGVGKSFSVASGIVSWTLTRPDSIALLTSGSYSQMEDTTWRPIKELLKRCTFPTAEYARALDSNPPRIEMPESSWYMKCVSPRQPDGLEGRHNSECLVVIEEADKPEITEEHFDSAGSSLTDAGDRMVAIANPPKDESNVVYEKMQSDRWNVVQFESFDSHNVQVDAREIDGEHIPGLVTLDLIAEDWEDWNDRKWPGLDRSATELNQAVADGELERDELIEQLRPGLGQVREAHNEDSTLSERWYRRRAGIMPPVDAQAHRPFYHQDVNGALEREKPDQRGRCLGVGIDVARKGGDANVVTALFERSIEQHRWQGTDHNENLTRCQRILDKISGDPEVAVDAVGEGSGNADKLKQSHNAVRFKAGTKAKNDDEYDNQWTEALYHLGDVLERISLAGVSQELRKELFTACRVIEYEVKKRKSGDVLKATPKEELKDVLDRSPDNLDSLAMASWASEAEPKGKKIKAGW